ncbi:hypothetical protein LSTR_LSTR001498 [Laodelphax striatellus]|uniref:Uncharacterized protein n=1 Tax=Laodelphax striatellus TaxID=195883 RepID=A0A482XAG4_LAOST|nr:hypothetical protein LSTR_LSTR001498 [Laodelphax striatellus]
MEGKKLTLILLLSVVILASVQSIAANPLDTDLAADYESELLKEAVGNAPSAGHEIDTRCKKKYRKKKWWKWW